MIAGSPLDGILNLGLEMKKRQRMCPLLELSHLGLQPSVFLLKRVLIVREFQKPGGDNVPWIRGHQSLQPPESQPLTWESWPWQSTTSWQLLFWPQSPWPGRKEDGVDAAECDRKAWRRKVKGGGERREKRESEREGKRKKRQGSRKGSITAGTASSNFSLIFAGFGIGVGWKNATVSRARKWER